MQQAAKTFLKDLVAQPTPSGFEQPGQAVVADYMRKYADEVVTDSYGNVQGILNPKGSPRIMLAGHCDEIGLMVMHIDEKGYLYFAALGGVNLQLLQGERVIVHSRGGPVPGVIGVKPIHLMDPKERSSGVQKIEDLWIDIGARDKKDALKAVEPGDPVSFEAGWRELRNGLVACRGFDNRIGAFTVTDVLRLLHGKKIKAAVHVVSTVQEEVGLRGSRMAAFGIDPDLGIAVDMGFSSDFPGGNPKTTGEAKLSEGPILHKGPTYNHKLYALLRETAEKEEIPFQMQPEARGTGTDAYAIQMTRAGVPAALVSIPSRYMHSPVETLALKDVENAVKLIAATIRQLKPGMDMRP